LQLSLCFGNIVFVSEKSACGMDAAVTKNNEVLPKVKLHGLKSTRMSILSRQTPTQKIPQVFFARDLGDRRQATGDRRQATGDRRQATGDRRQATGDRQLYTSSK